MLYVIHNETFDSLAGTCLFSTSTMISKDIPYAGRKGERIVFVNVVPPIHKLEDLLKTAEEVIIFLAKYVPILEPLVKHPRLTLMVGDVYVNVARYLGAPLHQAFVKVGASYTEALETVIYSHEYNLDSFRIVHKKSFAGILKEASVIRRYQHTLMRSLEREKVHMGVPAVACLCPFLVAASRPTRLRPNAGSGATG